MRVLVTGASGFVGRALCRRLADAGLQPVAAVRQPAPGIAAETVVLPDIDGATDWSSALRGISVVVHLAARVHGTVERAADSAADYRRVNVLGTRRLVQSAAETGVRRVVLLSSVKVHGESSTHPLTEADPPAPQDAYAMSKLEAERAVAQVASETGIEPVILRPPLVYGPQVRANFLRLMQSVARGVPLPLAGIDNRRSLVYLGNLVDAIAACAMHPAARGKTFLVSDGEDVSTPDLVCRLAHALRVRPRLFALPPALIAAAARCVGRADAVQRLSGSLTVDSRALRTRLDWVPPFTLDQGLQHTAQWYRESGAEARSKPR